jgi:hypothetical protein
MPCPEAPRHPLGHAILRLTDEEDALLALQLRPVLCRHVNLALKQALVQVG